MSTTQQRNVNGHILRIRETGGESNASTFSWDVYLFGAESGASPTLVNLSGLTDELDFSSPDGLVFSPSTGICWIQTDDGAFTDTTNCMMLAALPGQVGDGGPVTLNYGSTTVTSRRGEGDARDPQAFLHWPGWLAGTLRYSISPRANSVGAFFFRSTDAQREVGRGSP